MLRDDEVEMVKDSVSMKDLATAYGFKVSRSGFISCPFHGHDKNPSMKVYDGRRGFYCFTCHAGGDVIRFVRLYDGLDFEPAVRRISGMFGIALSDPDKPLTEEEKDRLQLRRLEREAEAAEEARKKERLKELAAEIQQTEQWLEVSHPLDFLWCYLKEKLEKLNYEWEARFNDS